MMEISTESTDKEDELLHHLRRPLIENSQTTYPWLVISHGKKNQMLTFYNVSEDRYYKRTIPELRNKHLLGIHYGCLVLDDYTKDDTCLFNPITQEKIQLPTLKASYLRCFLSKPPSNPDCLVMFIRNPHPLLICKLGDDKFFEYSADSRGDQIVAATGFNGNFYGMTLSRNIVTARLVDGTFEVQKLIDNDGCPFQVVSSLRPGAGFVRYYLVESAGELLYVNEYLSAFFPTYVEVFRIDTSGMKYEKLTNLGERTLFLSHSNGISCSWRESRIRKNCIYFVERYDRNMYVYDLEETRKTILLPCPILGSCSDKCWGVLP